MAMSKEAIQELKNGLKLAKASKKPFQFVYCAGDENGDPKLIIAKRVSSEKAKMRKAATKKQFASGRMEKLSKNTMAFVIEQTNAPKFKKDLQLVFGKGVPLIKKVEVMSAEEYDIFLMDAEAAQQEAAAKPEKSSRSQAQPESRSESEPESEESSEGVGGWMEGLAEDIVDKGNDLMDRFQNFFKDPDKLSNKELKELYAESNKIDGMCQTDDFKQNAKVLKNERNFRKNTAKVKDEYKVIQARIKEEKSVAKDLVKQIKAEGPNPDPATTAKMREQLQQTIKELEDMMKTASELKGKRRAG